jgi:excisionase family DNA binding protein
MKQLERIENTLARIETGMNRLLKVQAGPDQEWLAIKDAAAVTGLSEPHIRRAVRSGDLPAANVGTQGRPVWRIARTDLEKWMHRRMGGIVLPPITGNVTVTKKSRHFED